MWVMDPAVKIYHCDREPSAAREEIGTGIAGRTVLFISAAGTMIPGVYPAPFMEMAVKAIKPFLI